MTACSPSQFYTAYDIFINSFIYIPFETYFLYENYHNVSLLYLSVYAV